MILLNIIDNIYENSHFTTALIASVFILVFLFIIVLIIGIRDSRRDKLPKTLVEEDIKDVSFDIPPDSDKIKEDVTFEMPVLTRNLENFKKNLEEEIKSEEMAEVRIINKEPKQEDKKMVKVLDMNELKDTAIIEINNEPSTKPSKKEAEATKKEVETSKKETETSKKIPTPQPIIEENIDDIVYDLSDDF